MQSVISIQLEAAQEIRRLPRTLAGKAALAISATAFVALCAHVSMPLYFTPVPLTLQTLAVLLIGLAFGPTLGASTLLLYLAEGAAGLPVFSPQGPGGIAQLLGPTGGFLLSYPLAAAAAGSIVRAVRIYRPQFHAAVLAAFAADLVIFAIGAAWLAVLLHLTPAAAWTLAVAPFLPGEILKITAAAAAYTALLRWRRS
jgi:biotin transport system substrate-specific component